MGAVKPTILIVDDERRMCRSIEILLREQGPFETQIATDYYGAIEKLKEPVDLVLTDLTMPGKDGLELLRVIKHDRPELPVILMTAYSTVESAVTAMKDGARDYIVKPFENRELLRLIRRALPQSGDEVAEDAGENKEKTDTRGRFGDIIGKSRVMQEVYYRIGRAAETDSTVLITGESGTGKELVARAIHFSGNRKSKPFVPINCMAVPETLLESELFGHERGAFTGAVRQREGRFELAQDGTLFLDEIGEMPPSLQVKLLRVLQERQFERVGGTASIKVDVRIIAATNRNLAAAVQNGRFREDLYYRLNVVTIEMPPLRDRLEDLPLLINYYVDEKCRRVGVPLKTLSTEAGERLLHYDYPGNVRELENLIERAVVISRGSEIQLRDLPIAGASMGPQWDQISVPVEGGLSLLGEVHSRLERDVIERAIRIHPGKSNGELAELLGTSRRVLESRLKFYNLQKA
ncbi:MAG TPA: sigma-54 dependent transcriptional regulator [Bdellovibrionota bacterium]|nr:sigma-54 dependent transcriptional regulator [Bdellovibrionota bacterium]